MLYERWRQVARENRDELALQEAVGGSQWTFRQLEALGEAGSATSDPVVYPQGINAEFIISVLRAWRIGQVVCPVESEPMPAPDLRLPAGTVHLKRTSATSGAPRVIAFTETQLAADAENIVTTMGLRRDWPNLGVISLSHSYGFSNLVTPLLLHGIPLILSDSTLPEALRRAASAVGNITLPAVPALWRAWLEAKAIPSGVQLAISAGAPLPLLLEQAVFERTGIKVHNFYGASECGGIAYDASTRPRSESNCVGAPLCNVQVSVNAEECLEIRGVAVGETYWPDSDPNLSGGVFCTNDLVEIREEQVFLRGRVGDVINVAGRKVLPEAIECALSAHHAVRECLVFGAPLPETERTDIVVACLVTTSKVTAEELKDFLLSRLPAWQVPREWIFVDTMETNARGKFSRAEWRRRFAKSREI